MKTKTKEKIIRFVKRLLNYKDWEQEFIEIPYKTKQIKTINVVYNFSQEEMITKNVRQRIDIIQKALIKKLFQSGGVSVYSEYQYDTNQTKFTAEIQFLESDQDLDLIDFEN